MIVISHRGNLEGKNISLENSPEYIEKAITLGFDVEIDAREINGLIFLGHDAPQYPISNNFLLKYINSLWIHCKDISSYFYLKSLGDFNLFFHNNDDQVITSKGFLWAMNYVKDERVILVDLDSKQASVKSLGICTDFPQSVKSNLEKNDTI